MPLDPAGSVPAVTVAVCTRQRPALLERCLASLARLQSPNFNVLVVESGETTTATREAAARWSAAYAHTPVPGLSRARNHAARAAATEFIAFLDDDAVAEPGWLTALLAEFRAPAVAAVSGRVLPLSLDSEAERLFQAGGGFDGGDTRLMVNASTPGWFALANFGRLVRGTNMAFRRSVFHAWPGFDERLGAGATGAYEEQHAFGELIEAGHTVVYTPAAVVRHPFPDSIKGVRRRHLDVLRAWGTYAALLWFEAPHHRGRLLEHLRTRSRHAPGSAPLRLVSSPRAVAARLHGLWTYFRHVRGRPRGARQAVAPAG